MAPRLYVRLFTNGKPGMNSLVAHYDRIVSNLPKNLDKVNYDVSRIIIRNLNEQVALRKVWHDNMYARTTPHLGGSFRVLRRVKGQIVIGSSHKMAKGIDKGASGAWTQMNNPWWKIHGPHGPNRPLNYVRPALQSAFDEMRSLNRIALSQALK